MKLVLACICAVLATCVSGAEDYALSEDLIEKVNKKHSTWKAGKNFHPETPRTYLQQLTGVRTDFVEHAVLEIQKADKAAGAIHVPDFFDAREAWPDCPSIKRVIDQSRCGSCWAVSVASVLTDRICIHKNKQFNVSAEDLLTCCKSCGKGCSGGYPQEAFKYFDEEGIVSGGFYGSNEGCKPYTIGPCHMDLLHHCNLLATPKCSTTCRPGYPKSYKEDKYSGRVAYQIDAEIIMVQKEIMRNGPVQAAYLVYEDFYSYKSGVYQHVAGRMRGGHSVKIIGWGKENGIDYWLVANSWGEHWGDNGFFKIIRGRNEVEFESQINAGIP